MDGWRDAHMHVYTPMCLALDVLQSCVTRNIDMTCSHDSVALRIRVGLYKVCCTRTGTQ